MIVLSAIVVALAVAAGITIFQSSAVEANRDQVISDLMGLSTDAQAYYKKQAEFGGGGGSYEGWTIPEFYTRYDGGRIRVRIQAHRDRVVLIGIGTEKGRNGRTKVRVQNIVRPTGIQIRIRN
ncbi:MAG: hypothetical protein KJO48_13655 [Ignavibacteria bacterium]|nr:hypothetical protein [Ignavibacteria bacterium]